MARRPQSMACADSCHLGFCLCTTKGLHSRNWPFQPAVKLFSTFSSSALPTLLNALSHSQLVASLQPLPSSSSQTCRVDYFFEALVPAAWAEAAPIFGTLPFLGGISVLPSSILRCNQWRWLMSTHSASFSWALPHTCTIEGASAIGMSLDLFPSQKIFFSALGQAVRFWGH